MPKGRIIHLVLDVIVPARTSENEVEQAINAALDEPHNDWGTWEVGPVRVVGADATTIKA